MPKGLEALNSLKYMTCIEAGFNSELITYAEEMEHNEMVEEKYNIIEKELNALEIIKNKKVNLFHIWVFDDYTQYKQHYPFSEYNAEEDMLTNKEFDFLKEWLENENE